MNYQMIVNKPLSPGFRRLLKTGHPSLEQEKKGFGEKFW